MYARMINVKKECEVGTNKTVISKKNRTMKIEKKEKTEKQKSYNITVIFLLLSFMS